MHQHSFNYSMVILARDLLQTSSSVALCIGSASISRLMRPFCVISMTTAKVVAWDHRYTFGLRPIQVIDASTRLIAFQRSQQYHKYTSGLHPCKSMMHQIHYISALTCVVQRRSRYKYGPPIFAWSIWHRRHARILCLCDQVGACTLRKIRKNPAYTRQNHLSGQRVLNFKVCSNWCNSFNAAWIGVHTFKGLLANEVWPKTTHLSIVLLVMQMRFERALQAHEVLALTDVTNVTHSHMHQQSFIHSMVILTQDWLRTSSSHMCRHTLECWRTHAKIHVYIYIDIYVYVLLFWICYRYAVHSVRGFSCVDDIHAAC